MNVILKRANASCSCGTWKDEDHDVFADGKVVGRIREESFSFGSPSSSVGIKSAGRGSGKIEDRHKLKTGARILVRN